MNIGGSLARIARFEAATCLVSILWFSLTSPCLWKSRFFPHIFVWGSCFWFCIPSAASSSRRLLSPIHNTLSTTVHTQLVFTHNLSSHHLLTHNLSSHVHTRLVVTPLAHAQLVIIPLVLTHNLSSHHLLTHNLSSHNLLTHKLLTHNLSSHHLLTHNLSSHNLLWRGRRGTYGTGLALVARLVLGVAPGRRGCWRGRRGTWRHPSSFHVAGVVLGDIDFHFCVAGVALMALGWLWWRAWF